MSESRRAAFDLSKRVHDVVAQYVRRRTEMKSGIEWDDFKDKRTIDAKTNRPRLDVPKEYHDTLQKVCEDAFLRMRACKSREDFVTYFTGTICSVPQYLPLDEYQGLAEALLQDRDWERVKALAMLAISAESHLA